jgi:leucyl aminopeptidase
VKTELINSSMTGLQATAVCVPLFEGAGATTEASALDHAAGGALADARETGRFMRRVGEALVAPAGNGLGARRVIWLGLGPERDLDPVRLRNALSLAGETLRRAGSPHLALHCAGLLRAVPDARELARALVEGVILGAFDRGEHRSGPRPPQLDRLILVGLDDAATEGVRQGDVLGRATNLARSLQNRPGNLLGPDELEAEAGRVAGESGLDFQVLDQAALERLGAGAILAVGRGSARRPRLVVMHHRPRSAVPGIRLGLVGKGVTFDTGGYSLKPQDGMQRMNYDMSGAAAVIAATGALARLEAPIEVLAVCPVVENMVSGDAFRVGDVITTLSGKTVEIISTDAEGRLILADALTYAQREGATHLVDVATLTGAMRLALGHVNAGAFPNDAELMSAVRAAAAAAGERIWEMPMHADYDAGIRSQLADLKNSHGRPGGAISAAFFLRNFVEDVPWVHLDIAGAAWNDQADMRTIPQGPQGFGTRTLAHLPWVLAQQAGA